MASHCPNTLRGRRDRAILLMGFAGAFRRSELAALTVDDLEKVDEGIRVHVRRSKTDQEGAGEVVPVIKGNGNCPVVAVKAWLEAAGIPRTRRKLYLGHGQTDVTDLYEWHEVKAFVAEDRAKLQAYIGQEQRNAVRVMK